MSKEMPPRVWVTPEWKDIGKGIHRHLAFTRPDYERHELGVPYVPEKSVEEALSLARTQARAEAFEEAARMTIEATRIPDDAIRRGTGVRDHLVVWGENFASCLRAKAFEEAAQICEKHARDWNISEQMQRSGAANWLATRMREATRSSVRDTREGEE